MRIAQIAPLYEAVPPKLYGGTERVVAHLCDELVWRDHEVTLFASGDSRTEAMLVPCRDVAIRLDIGVCWDWPAHLAMMAEVRERADEFDILHFHVDCFHLPFFTDVAERTVTTVHGRLDCKDLWRLYRRYSHYPMVSICDNQRTPLPFLNWTATVHHGYPVDQYVFSPRAGGGYLAFLGRISPEKGVDRAVEIARTAQLPLRIAAKIDAADRAYFEKVVAPLLEAPFVEFIGEIGEAEKSDFLGGALALLAPIDWPEPFGLVMIEAMACGSPVIAFRRGSVPEIVEHGVSGFVVDDVAGAVAAVKAAPLLNRALVRAAFEKRFTVEAMTDQYEAIYSTLLNAGTVPAEAVAPGQDATLAGRAA